MSKTAVVIFNLGGPDSKEAIKPFLFNFFMDKNIIRAPLPVRWMVAKLISIRRTKKEAGDSYAELGHKSPLLENTLAQAKVLQEKLGQNYKTFVCMRYWHPMAEEVAAQVKAYDPDHILLLPFYPQFSTTTTRSSFQTWEKAAAKCSLNQPTTRICCYPTDKGFVKASADNIRKRYDEAVAVSKQKGLAMPRVLFSAHGLPEDIVKDGDPYQWQAEQTAQEVVQTMAIEGLDWKVCYQSRVGPKKWIGPSTEDALIEAAKDNIPIVIYPHAFVNEHVETLVEIEIEYREFAEQKGVPYFARVPTVDSHETFIEGLAAIVKKHEQHIGTFSNTGQPLCPKDFSECCMRVSEAA